MLRRMGIRRLLDWLIVAVVLLILYTFAGHSFVTFYLGGKTELLETAERINRQCAEQATCPTALPGWRQQFGGTALARGNMLYFTGDEAAGQPQSFRLVYSFFMPDDWFEASGGVGKPVTAGWTGRP